MPSAAAFPGVWGVVFPVVSRVASVALADTATAGASTVVAMDMVASMGASGSIIPGITVITARGMLIPTTDTTERTRIITRRRWFTVDRRLGSVSEDSTEAVEDFTEEAEGFIAAGGADAPANPPLVSVGQYCL